MIQKLNQFVIIPIDIVQTEWFLNIKQLVEGHDLKKFLQGANASGHGNESVCFLRHQPFPVPHSFYDDQFSTAMMGDFTSHEFLGNDSDYFLTVGKHFVSNHTHQSDTPCSINQALIPFDHFLCQCPGCSFEYRGVAFARAAVDRDFFHFSKVVSLKALFKSIGGDYWIGGIQLLLVYLGRFRLISVVMMAENNGKLTASKELRKALSNL